MRASRGFTLLEILLVVALIGLAATAVTLTIGRSGPEDKMVTEGQRFIALFQLVQEETELAGQELGLRVEDHGYLWVALDGEGKWQPLADDRYLTEKRFDDSISLTLALDDLPFQQEERLSEGGKLFEDKPLFEEQGEEQKYEPQVLIFPGGEATPFSLTFKHLDLAGEWRVDSNDFGQAQLITPQDEEGK